VHLGLPHALASLVTAQSLFRDNHARLFVRLVETMSPFARTTERGRTSLVAWSMNPEWKNKSLDFVPESPVIAPLDFLTADAGLTAQLGEILIPFAQLMGPGRPIPLVRATDGIYAMVVMAALVPLVDQGTERQRRS